MSAPAHRLSSAAHEATGDLPGAHAAAPRVLVYVDGGRVGDMLNLLPAIRGMRRCFPEHRVTWLSGYRPSTLRTSLAPLAEGLVDEFVDGVPIGKRPRDLLRWPLRDRYFDVIVDCQTRIITSLVVRRIPHRVFVSAAVRFRLSDRRPAGPAAQPAALIDRFTNLVSLAAGTACPLDFALDVPAPHRAAAARLLPDGPTWVGFAPGAADRRKCWPLAHYVELARRQATRGRMPVFLVGPEERGWIERIAAEVPSARFPEHETGPGDPAGPTLTVALAERIRAGVANDSGAGHMLAAGGRPLVTLFGPTDPAKFRVNTRAQWTPLCAASFGGTEMKRIPLDAVDEALEALLRV